MATGHQSRLLNMRKLLILPLLILFVGCASYGINHLHGKASGVYNYNGVPITGNFEIDHWGYIGFESVNMEQIINDTNTRSTANQTI